MPQSQAAPENWFKTRIIQYTSASLPIAKRVGFFLGGSPALELASSSFYYIRRNREIELGGQASCGKARGLKLSYSENRKRPGRNSMGNPYNNSA